MDVCVLGGGTYTFPLPSTHTLIYTASPTPHRQQQQKQKESITGVFVCTCVHCTVYLQMSPAELIQRCKTPATLFNIPHGHIPSGRNKPYHVHARRDDEWVGGGNNSKKGQCFEI